MSGLGIYDPIEQMRLEERSKAVELDKFQQKARDWLERVSRESLGKLGIKDAKVLPLEFYPHGAKLSVVCYPVPELAIGSGLMKRLIADTKFTMYMCGGVGLAAPQLGLEQRFFVADWSETRDKPATIINPEITWWSDEVTREKEACLSMPGVKLHVVRPSQIKARWMDEFGKPVETELEGWAARIFLHELDHLDGKMMIEHESVSRVERRLAKKVPERILKGETKPKKARRKKRRR